MSLAERAALALPARQRLLAAGFRVAVFSQHRERVLAVGASLAAHFGGESVFAAAVDIRNPAEVEDFVQRVSDQWGPPSVLVCNAGYSPKRKGERLRFDEIPLCEWNDVLCVNLTGAMVCCQKVAPIMAAQNYGRIIFIGSVAARTMPRIAGASYVASKAGLSGLSRTLVNEYASRGLTVNTVAPGRILTEMTMPANSPANKEALGRIPAGRLGGPDDIAAAVEFLASPSAGFINGAVLDINGGEFLPV